MAATLLFVAHKFETGYDNPNLTYMYTPPPKWSTGNAGIVEELR